MRVAITRFVSGEVVTTTLTLVNFIAEDASTARRHLKLYGYTDLNRPNIILMNEHSGAEAVNEPLRLLMSGTDVGLMSDAGCPGIADPGAEMVRAAHRNGIRVRPLVGPSSIVLGIMASGFNGQNFSFNGYLPVDKTARTKKIRELETTAVRHRQAQFFIETPYRNSQMFAALLQSLQSSTLLFVGINLTAPNEFAKSMSVAEWKTAAAPDMHKVPAVFGIFV